MEYILDFDGITSRESLHDHLAYSLALPCHYGRNLDALYDCLCDMQEAYIVIKNASSLLALGGYGESLLAVFKDVEKDKNSENFIVEIQ